MTIAELIASSLRLLGVYDSHSQPNANQLDDGLFALNSLLYSLSSERNGIYQVTEESFALTSGTADYTTTTLGTTRPTRILKAYVTSDTFDYGLKVISAADYADIPDKTIEGIPEKIYLDNGYPASTVKLWPVPDGNYTLNWQAWKPLGQYATTAEDFDLPHEYHKAVRFLLAADLMPEYGAQDQMVSTVAQNELRKLKNLHSQPVPMMATNPFLGSRGYNIRSDY